MVIANFEYCYGANGSIIFQAALLFGDVEHNAASMSGKSMWLLLTWEHWGRLLQIYGWSTLDKLQNGRQPAEWPSNRMMYYRAAWWVNKNQFVLLRSGISISKCSWWVLYHEDGWSGAPGHRSQKPDCHSRCVWSTDMPSSGINTPVWVSCCLHCDVTCMNIHVVCKLHIYTNDCTFLFM